MRSVFSTSVTWLLASSLISTAQAASSPQHVAERVDEAIATEVFADRTAESALELAPRCDDETFLRRAYLDIVGDIPAPEAAIAFLLDPSSDKRQRLVQQLLDDPHYGQNWARYWRDVVFFRAQEDRARIAANAMVVDLADQLNDNQGWDTIASKFITAKGDVRENGHTAIIMAQDGRTEETTAEISRIFLGIQIQCAQCHDHPYDRWKREQFHELASFFPRIAVRNVRDMTKRSFEVYSNDRYDKRKRKAPNNDRRPVAEHRMPDLDQPEVPGQVMLPRFFLTSAELAPGRRDAERREQLADWLTDNEWFAIAIVNRMWSELVGEGFYEPVDDIGPDREATAPTAVKLLAGGFQDSGHDLKWLLATIMETAAYQREARPRRGPTGTSLVANVPQRLRSDQLFNALFTALDVEEQVGRGSGYGGPRASGPRAEFAELFGYDPSTARESIAATIPQSLALMNAYEVNRYLRATNKNLLGGLIEAVTDDEALVVELYLRCLSREPDDEELAGALEYCAEIRRRDEAFEDLLWVLINSAEFQHRR
ncbi:MAG: DUF1549 domain-containing protein [Bythopirellula sp.]